MQASRWENESASVGSLIACHTGFIEQQAPVYDVEYFIWFVTHVLSLMEPFHLKTASSWGPGHTVSYYVCTNSTSRVVIGYVVWMYAALVILMGICGVLCI